ncbi:MAG: class I SAM-dependent rRNA methyltransferase [Flavobacteriales bacterium]|nr:class I SAM-dependent rRNA methyltransferase [Flavobacteriales bacterium]MCB9363472.1 class I SAM-dependent rRNA methyltransferase [Flavobacteriales bacterium]
MELKTIVLHRDKEKSLERKHPWVFSGAINRIISDTGEAPIEGELVEVVNAKNKFLALGYFSDATIAVRVISFEKTVINQKFWTKKVQSAFNVRESLGLTENPSTNMYRLMHAEGDGIPGLIIDFYNGTAVIQAHTISIYNNINFIVEALKNVYGKKLTAIYNKSAESLAKQTNLQVENEYLFQDGEVNLIGTEYGCDFNLDWINGQKTGFFLDQRENRKLIGDFSKNKKVLNTFCYSGGFSISALKAGAKEVHSVDSSQKAIDLTDANVTLNKLKKHKSFTSDTLDYLKDNTIDYDVIILDPPAYAKNQKAKHNAVQGYKRLNAMALKQIKPGGILFTFSCSQAVNRKLFYDTITAAAIEVGRNVRVLHHLSQPADHPVNIYHPEGEYLKGLVLYVE